MFCCHFPSLEAFTPAGTIWPDPYGLIFLSVENAKFERGWATRIHLLLSNCKVLRYNIIISRNSLQPEEMLCLFQNR